MMEIHYSILLFLNDLHVLNKKPKVLPQISKRTIEGCRHRFATKKSTLNISCFFVLFQVFLTRDRIGETVDRVEDPE